MLITFDTKYKVLINLLNNILRINKLLKQFYHDLIVNNINNTDFI